MKFLLDTDTCIYALRHDADVRMHMESVTPEDVAVSAMNEAELRYGALNSQHPDRRTKDVEAFLEPIMVLPFDAEAAKQHARLRMALRKMPIGERDLVIASVASAHRLTVVTHNQREFSRIPGLETIDWLHPPGQAKPKTRAQK
ncbi:MAG TPA: type II toxin-antitoxin system VapC family toxin [Polyangia bacterium]|nr:type II toxin-antitoxin system VapC family toxin [Polyangia bacterium]